MESNELQTAIFPGVVCYFLRNVPNFFFFFWVFHIDLMVFHSQLLCDFQECRASEYVAFGLKPVKEGRRKPPHVGHLKVNVDAEVGTVKGFISVGAVVRDSGGLVVACLSKRLIGNFSPHVAECLALREWLEFAKPSGLQIDVAETDPCNLVRDRGSCGYFGC